MSEQVLEYQLSPNFPKVQIISETIGNVIGFIVLVVLFWLDNYFEWPTWAFWILFGLLVFNIVGTIWGFIEPKYLYRSWRYQIDKEFLQLSYGVLKKEWTTIPMSKIQSVSTSQGPIMRKYQIRSIKVETMGSSHVIPGLEEQIASEWRAQIAELAKLKEVDE
ncbi:hypothetical protein SAMN04487943_101535 [Gracilibacillus orientalis]|uniref:YdbS-like PH domain-containing protein n=1 Tax=Gracilibacillus orientalis TaxID=334253 RepID=A0A1I4HP32_9BACI|nr:PH domain-containing protein [Gracilibacillus orientalis]SFL43507.1 hypothetical protein SAMN04487943_101535 [Gracilibacillus orientalis]